MARFDTTLEAAGAEHLVIGHLLIARIQAFRAHANQPGYDIIAVDPLSGRSVRVQVKSRAATDAGGFKISNFDFDFIVLVRLNRGKRSSIWKEVPEDVLHPQFYVIPQAAMIVACKGAPVKVTLSAIPEADRYLDDWDSIKKALWSQPDAGT